MSHISHKHIQIGGGGVQPLNTREPSIAQGAGLRRLDVPIVEPPSVRGSASASIAMICTANRCRSPLGEHILRSEAAARGLSVRVFSMGLLESGLPMPERGVDIAREFGLDLSRHRSQHLRLDQLAEVDLVLGMSRGHGREVVSVLPDLWPRVFTLKQFSRFLAGRTMPRRARLASWIEAEAGERPRNELIGRAAQDDIADPLLASAAEWRQVIGEIRSHVAQVLDGCQPLLATSPRLRQN
jgi:protein-tyrosine phosphatase